MTLIMELHQLYPNKFDKYIKDWVKNAVKIEIKPHVLHSALLERYVRKIIFEGSNIHSIKYRARHDAAKLHYLKKVCPAVNIYVRQYSCPQFVQKFINENKNGKYSRKIWYLQDQVKYSAIKIIRRAVCSSSITNKVWFCIMFQKILNKEFNVHQLKSYAIQTLQKGILRQTGNTHAYSSCRRMLHFIFVLNPVNRLPKHEKTASKLHNHFLIIFGYSLLNIN